MRALLAGLLPAALLLSAAQAATPDLCAGRAGCVVAGETPAGQAADGTALSLVELTFATPPAGTWADGLDCRDGWRELHLVKDGVATSLLELCNDGYGAAGVGADTLEIGDNRLTHTQEGGSAWRWMESTTYALDPALVLREAWYSVWAPGQNYLSGRWDWTDWSRGEIEWYSPPCGADGAPPLDAEPPDDAALTSAALIPLVEPGVLPADLAEVPLGTCAAELMAATGRGFVLNGETAAALDDLARLRVLAVEPDLLIVTVLTTRLAAGGPDWQQQDHVEIWQGPRLGHDDFCIPGTAAARQWAVRLADGAVFAGAGAEAATPPALLWRRQGRSPEGGLMVTIALRLAEPPENLTVLFSKADAAGGQAWQLASSDLRPGEAASLGSLQSIAAGLATCGVVDGRLDLLTPGRPPGSLR